MIPTKRIVALNAVSLAAAHIAAPAAQEPLEVQRTVCGKVQKVTCDEQGSRLTTLELKPKSKDLSVTILPLDRLQFTPRPEYMYRDTDVCATGRVQAQGRRRLLIVSRPEDVEVRKRFKLPDVSWVGPYFTECDEGVVRPVLIKEMTPSYTPRAMEARLQGVVALDAMVSIDGAIGEIRMRRSLDPDLGLDDEAVRVVRQWRFKPGTRFGQPVPILVQIEVSFRLK
jgi:TonB family protein